jgi:hydrophobe/amphiphile efflux-1 (HAE1) family protein
MALNVSAWSIRHPLPAIVFSIVMLVLGWTSFMKLPITRLPNADIPMISVVVAEFGTAPAELEAQVTKPIEDAVSGVEGIRNIRSSITDGVSATTIMFSLETNTDRALNDVKDAVTRVRNNLPQNINEPLVQRVDVVGLPIVTYAAISPGKTPEQLSWYVDNVVVRALQGLHGVAQVERLGGVERQILVSLDPDRLEAVGLTALDVSHRLRGTIANVAGGRASIGGRDEAIRTVAGSKSLEGLAGTMISLPSGGEVRLDDLGIVTDTIAERTTFARFNGQPVVAVDIRRSKGASDVVVAAAVQQRIDQLKAANPENVDLKLIDSSVEFTRGHYESAIHTLFEGALLAVIVVFLFLRDLRTTVIAAVSLPLSIFPAFWAMDMLGFSLNLVSLLAITLSTGVIVDDAIVEVENIVRHVRMGKSAYGAAMEAADEIGLAVIAISLTIVAMFAPASFMSGIAGQFFKQFGITVSVLVLFSLLAARLVTPMLAAYFLRPRHRAEPPPGRTLAAYTKLVSWSVRHYVSTVGLGMVLFAGSIWSTGLLPKGFLPAQDAARSLLTIELPPGSQLSDTERMTEDIVASLRKRPEVTSVFVEGGRVPPTTTEVRMASLIVNYTPKSSRSVTQHELELMISRDLAETPDIRSWFLDENGLRAVSLFATGADSRTVDSVANDLAGQMHRVPLVTNVTAATSLERPELRISPQNDLVARLGVSTESLAETIRVATIGDFGPALAKFDAGDRLVPIRVQLEERARTDPSVLEQLRVPLPMGPGSVPLNAIANIQLAQGPTSISRYNRERLATVSADLVGNAALGDAMAKINELPVMKSLPKGISVGPSGDAESLNELAAGFQTAMIRGLMMVYAVLVLLFGSFLQPITILFSLPLSIGGGIIALLLTGEHLTTPVWIGVLMLMGIVAKNAIMLVDFAMESMYSGVDRNTAIVDAGRKRARPIVMTTVAMIAGMMPSALAIGAGGEFRAPMAIAVIGGLAVSTLLSLVFVPAFMAMIDDVGRVVWSFGERFFTPEKSSVGRAGPGERAGPVISES